MVPLSYRFVAREVAHTLEFADVVAAVVDGHLADVFTEANEGAAITAELVLVLSDDAGGTTPPYPNYEQILAATRPTWTTSRPTSGTSTTWRPQVAPPALPRPAKSPSVWLDRTGQP